MQRIIVLADDFTGATDIGGAFADTGRAVRLHLTNARQAASVESPAEGSPPVEIFAMKIRSCPAQEALAAVNACLDAIGYDRSNDQVYYKYCSTFDSTSEGNIGPVLDALLARTGAHSSLVVPAFPDNARTQYLGYLYVGEELLAESPMATHPINPMRDSSVLRLLAAQSESVVRLVPWSEVRGPNLHERLTGNPERPELLVADALDNQDLSVLAHSIQTHRLVSGGSGLAQNYPVIGPPARLDMGPLASNGRVIIVGSQSSATQRQLVSLQRMQGLLVLELDLDANRDDEEIRIDRWLGENLRPGRMLLVKRPDARFDDVPGHPQRIEQLLGKAAESAYRHGVREFIVAGGETAGAVTHALDARQLRIGAEIAPGVPWCRVALGNGDEVSMALKSGNFGTESFFSEAWEVLDK
ncbi:MAG: four-carbon acid sugar kinase family protein [Brooklawnia sp.]|jgi:uncharacterized protein YgbK (DUF1537 family)